MTAATPDQLAVLGRSVVVGVGQECPPEWSGFERVRIDSIDPETAERMHQAWRTRQALVIELAPGCGVEDPTRPPEEKVTGRQPWEWPVDLVLPGERLHHSVWANSVDHRDRAIWSWQAEAVALGARAAPAGAAADVLLPGGRPAVCDGGPLDVSVRDRLGGQTALLHRIGLEHGSLVPLGEGAVPTSTPPSPSPLAEDQLRAVDEPRAGARVIAPAGSGKTRVLTERARRLTLDWGMPPAALALVAYNVRAAGEMRDRLVDVPQLRIRTLNAMALRLCGRDRTIDEREVRNLLSGLVSLPRRAETDPAAPWIEALSRVRLGLAHPEAVEDQLADVSGLAEVAADYRSRLAEQGTVDFDEQVTAAIERLLADPAFRVRSRRFARILLVDEFQDLTPAHMLLLRLLGGPAGEVFAVGDDDQTIYGYAGATPRWLVEFERWFPGASRHALEVNYRCPPTVVKAAANLLSHNDLRLDKQIRPRPADPDGGESVNPQKPSDLQILGATAGGSPDRGSSTGSAALAAGRVAELLEEGASPAEIAVLARVNASLIPVQVLLAHRSVPVESRGERSFLARGGVRAALAWLALATAPADRLPAGALQEAARRPRRGMSQGLLQLLGRSRGADGLDGLVDWLERKGSSRDADRIEAFASDVAQVRRLAARGAATAAVLALVRKQVGDGGLDASAGALDAWSHGAIAAHVDDLDALGELAVLEPDPVRFPLWLADQLAVPSVQGGVTLASVHAVKGREWPHVIVHHVTDGLVPHRLAEDREEERRVFHVAITRASRTLTVVTGAPPSPFLGELERERRPGERTTPLPADAASGEPGAGTAPTGRGGRDRPSAGPGARAARGPSRESPPRGRPELLTVLPGAVFRRRGHEHEVIEAREEGAVCRVGGGPATTVLAYGTEIEVAGTQAVLAHPAAPSALETLRAWRTATARSIGKPPYVVFDDRTLVHLAARLPVTDVGLLSVPGIGQVKLDSYGADLVEITEAARSA